MSYKIYLSIFIFSLMACNSSEKASNPQNIQESHPYANELIHETSPYLLQHAHNPVNWYPWGEKALNKAKSENKLLLISVGYAACHWCHVMEHESFEDTTIATFMNENFVCIKVDREERPDIDQIYMDAVQLVTGSGGWPLNCFALPDGKPFYGGTYFPKEKWSSLMERISKFYKEKPEEIELQANKLLEGIVANENIYSDKEVSSIQTSELKILVEEWMKGMDFEKGGHNRSPKFPLPVGFEFLMQYEKKGNNPEVTQIVNTTLTKMAEGGIYDQIGGGFARYSTDENWKVPHFEKMLYDNAQLLSLYSNRYKETKTPLYKTIVEETSRFIESEWRDASGGVYSSLDADSEGEEGKYYVWTSQELDEVLKEDSKLFKTYYNVKSNGNWEHGKNILFVDKSKTEFAKQNNLSLEEFENKLKKAKSSLMKTRAKRIKPGLDDKILTAWNGLLLKGYIDAYKAFGEQKYLDLGLKSAKFLQTKMITNDFQVYRNFKGNKSTINGFLDDYAFAISGFINLYQATFDDHWLNLANDLTQYVNSHFSDAASPFYFFTSDLDKKLVTRKKAIPDNVIASSNSEMAKNLYVLGHYFYNTEYITKAEQMALQVKENAKVGGTYYANWDQLLFWMAYPPNEVAIVGDKALDYLKEWNAHYLPNAFVLGSKTSGELELLQNKYVANETRVYVCKNKSCKAPVYNVKEGLSILD